MIKNKLFHINNQYWRWNQYLILIINDSCLTKITIIVYSIKRYGLDEFHIFILFQVKTDYTEETFSISNYPLSAAVTCSKLCTAFEEVWGIV